MKRLNQRLYDLLGGSITYIIQHSEKYHIPVPNRDSLKRMSDKIRHLISEINMSSDESLQSARTEKTDRDLTKPQKEIFYRRQEEGYGKYLHYLHHLHFCLFDKKSKIELYSR
jgi:phosphoglycerate-specific signal transduction histidine kinase